jgi:hypothetical protein
MEQMVMGWKEDVHIMVLGVYGAVVFRKGSLYFS